jgi:hypothetical protein
MNEKRIINYLKSLKYLSGGLYFNPTRKWMYVDGLRQIDGFTFYGTIENGHVEIYSFTSDTPLNGEDNIYGLSIPPPYIYPILFYSDNKELMLLLGPSGKVIEKILNMKLTQDFNFNLRNFYIKTGKLVDFIVGHPEKKLLLTSAHAFYPADGNALKKIVFYGEDLDLAGIFRENLPKLNIYKCGIKDFESNQEIGVFGNDGKLYFKFSYGYTQIIFLTNLIKMIKEEGLLVKE